MSVPQELFEQREELLREQLQYWFAGEVGVKHEVAGSINRKLRALDEEWQRNTETPHPTPPPNPLVGFIMRHFDDIENDKQALRNRAESAVKDYAEKFNHGQFKTTGEGACKAHVKAKKK